MTHRTLILLTIAAMLASMLLYLVSGTVWVLLPCVAYQMCVLRAFLRGSRRR